MVEVVGPVGPKVGAIQVDISSIFLVLKCRPTLQEKSQHGTTTGRHSILESRFEVFLEKNRATEGPHFSFLLPDGLDTLW